MMLVFMSLQDKEAQISLEALISDFERLEITHDNYGLIHYDYEDDNLFLNNQVVSIDYNDSFYGFYALDIMNTCDSFKDDSKDIKIGYESKDNQSSYRYF